MKSTILKGIIAFISVTVFAACSNVTVESKDIFEVVEFPDGSMAFLNLGSSVQYNSKFESRIVEIEGEVFFEVEPGDKPFVVHCSRGEIEVLGTEFYVSASEEELDVEVQDGVVIVKGTNKQTKLKRGQRAIINVNQNEIQIGQAEFKYRGWMTELRSYFKAIGKEFKKGSKVLKKESKSLKKDLSKEIKKNN